MEFIRANLEAINVPTSETRIYKDECVFSYDTPVCLSNAKGAMLSALNIYDLLN